MNALTQPMHFGSTEEKEEAVTAWDRLRAFESIAQQLRIIPDDECNIEIYGYPVHLVYEPKEHIWTLTDGEGMFRLIMWDSNMEFYGDATAYQEFLIITKLRK